MLSVAGEILSGGWTFVVVKVITYGTIRGGDIATELVTGAPSESANVLTHNVLVKALEKYNNIDAYINSVENIDRNTLQRRYQDGINECIPGFSERAEVDVNVFDENPGEFRAYIRTQIANLDEEIKRIFPVVHAQMIYSEKFYGASMYKFIKDIKESVGIETVVAPNGLALLFKVKHNEVPTCRQRLHDLLPGLLQKHGFVSTKFEITSEAPTLSLNSLFDTVLFEQNLKCKGLTTTTNVNNDIGRIVTAGHTEKMFLLPSPLKNSLTHLRFEYITAVFEDTKDSKVADVNLGSELLVNDPTTKSLLNEVRQAVGTPTAVVALNGRIQIYKIFHGMKDLLDPLLLNQLPRIVKKYGTSVESVGVVDQLPTYALDVLFEACYWIQRPNYKDLSPQLRTIQEADIRIQAALNVGETAWNRSKIMLAGEGRAGKTALAKSFMGLSFEHTESTCGIEQFRVEVSHAVVGSAWEQCKAPDSELDAAIVALAKVSHFPTTQPTPILPEASDAADGDEPLDVSGTELNSLMPEKIERIRSALLSDNLFHGSELLVSLFDFAGEDVFQSLHSYFLTHHGVYVIVFDMNWLAGTTVHSTAALENLSFWLNSVAVHTKVEGQGSAPIYLVGTHKDQVADVEVHSRISQLLNKTFSYSAAWPFVVENYESRLVYFPVDNTLGAADPTMGHLMTLIEKSIRGSEYISIKRPLSWYKALDAIQGLTRPMISLAAAAELALENGVEADRVIDLLEFLRDMGVLLWYNEPALKETVVLDPVTSFVKPVTRVICQLDVHMSDCHRLCRKLRREEFDHLFSTGVATPDILRSLLSSEGEDADTLILLMLKYGLAMCWWTDVVANKKYLVPSLFPATPSSSIAKEWMEDSTVRTAYFACSLDRTLGKVILKECDLPNYGFLPKGLFDRLLCAALEWCHESDTGEPVLRQLTLCKSFAILKASDRWFRITLLPGNHCVQVDVVGGDSGVVFQDVLTCLWQRWKAVLSSGSHTVYMYPFAPYVGQAEHHLLLVPATFEAYVDAKAAVDVESSYALSPRYHCFLSYRWGDKPFVTALHDHIVEGMVRGLRVRVFLDDKVFHTADRIQQIFFDSILNTEVFVPVVSPTAILRMLNHNPLEVDNVLLEWLTALLLIKFPGVHVQTKGLRRLQYINPICFSGPAGDGYFAVKSELPRVVPTATINELRRLIIVHEITVSREVDEFLNTVTVKEVVDGVMQSLVTERVTDDNGLNLVPACSEEIMQLFLRIDKITVPADYLAHKVEGGGSSV
jgi:GTPase SAR1 family protein